MSTNTDAELRAAAVLIMNATSEELAAIFATQQMLNGAEEQALSALGVSFGPQQAMHMQLLAVRLFLSLSYESFDEKFGCLFGLVLQDSFASIREQLGKPQLFVPGVQ